MKDAIQKYSYQEHNTKKPVCSTQVMKRIINRFENTGNVHYKLNGGRTSKANDVATILKVVEAKEMVESTNNYEMLSVRKISTKSGGKPTTVYRILTRKWRQNTVYPFCKNSHTTTSPLESFLQKCSTKTFLTG